MYRTLFKRLVNYFPYRSILGGIFFSGLILCTISLVACNKEAQQHSYNILTFGTLLDITLYDVDKELADTAFQQLLQSFDKNHQDWSPWTDGDLAQLNSKLKNSKPNTVITVPEHLIPILNRSALLSLQSDNFYNPTIGQLINLWQFHKYQDADLQPPDDHQIQLLVNKNPQMSDISFIAHNQLINSNPAVSLNFGAFAKGYAIELGIKRLKKLGIKNAIINAGGDLSVIGQHGDRAWNIGIRHPRKDNLAASVKVKDNESIFTSGDYERFYFYQDKRYHHILDPRTGYPTNGTQSVTVLHKDAGLADAAATAIFVAGKANWHRIAKKMGVAYVMLIDNEGTIHLTTAMRNRVVFHDISSTTRIIVSEEL